MVGKVFVNVILTFIGIVGAVAIIKAVGYLVGYLLGKKYSKGE